MVVLVGDDAAKPDPSGWRLPARALEQAIVQVLVETFRDPVFPASIGVDLTAGEIVRIRDALADLANRLAGMEAGAVDRAAVLVQRAVIAAASLTLVLDAPALSAALASHGSTAACAASFDPPALAATSRSRGQADAWRAGARARPPADPKRGSGECLDGSHQAGRSFDEIAADAGTSKRRVQHMIHLAFLAPDIVGEILRGAQPPGTGVVSQVVV